MTPGSADRYLRVFESFTRYATARHILCCDDVVTSTCNDFVNASLSWRHNPSPSTRRFRLTVVRDAYRGLIEAGIAVNDPAAGLQVEWRTRRPLVCPLTPVEAQRLRLTGRTWPTDTLRPAVVTVAVFGASHREVSESVVSDVDLPGERLQLSRGAGTPRWVKLDSPAILVLRTRIAAQQRGWRQRRQPWNPLVVPLAMHRPLPQYPARSVAPTVSMNLSRALQRAGVTRIGVRPRSVREYAANRTYALTGRVEDVAHLLGLASLDTAAGFLDHGWQDRWGPTIRSDAAVDG